MTATLEQQSMSPPDNGFAIMYGRASNNRMFTNTHYTIIVFGKEVTFCVPLLVTIQLTISQRLIKYCHPAQSIIVTLLSAPFRQFFFLVEYQTNNVFQKQKVDVNEET